MWKRALSSLLGVAVILGAFVTMGQILPKQEPIEVETVGDMPSDDKGPGSPFSVEAKGAILIDAETGEVLFQQDAHKELPLASVTKVMTMLLVMEAVDDGKITLEDEITISERAAQMGGSQMYMEPGETHTVTELMKGVAMASANDGCVALSEHVAGSEEIFVERMNAKAQDLGMRDTHFVNTNGLPAEGHYSSAYDIAVMSMELYKYEETHKWFTTWQDTITIGLPGKEKEFGLTNTNKLVKHYPGCNGIKTGFTSDAGYCLSASATRDNTHFVAVALGCTTSAIRNQQICKMFDYGFANFQSQIVAEEGQVMAQIDVKRGTPQKIDILSSQKISVLVPKGKTDSVKWEMKIEKEINLPLKMGDPVGTINVIKDGQKVGTYELIAATDVKKASFKELLKRMLSGGEEKEYGKPAEEKEYDEPAEEKNQ